MHSPGATPNPISSGPRSCASRLLAAATGAFPVSRWGSNASDADELRYPATIFVWGRWSIFFACVFLLIYRPEFILFKYVAYMLFLALLAGLNGYVNYRLRSGRTVTLRWMLALSAMDVVLITAGMVAGGGFSNYFFYLLYYPALAGFAVFFGSFRLTFAWVTMTAVIYTVVSLTVGEGLNFDAKDDKALIARIAVMYTVVTAVNLVSSSERMKRQEAVERERALQRERVELSRTIHDTVAQSVYVVGLGIETARDLARKTGDELAERLDETYTLSRTALWELRHPIDSGRIFEGMGLGGGVELPRLFVHGHYVPARRGGAGCRRTGLAFGRPWPALRDRPQRDDQRVAPCQGQPGRSPPRFPGRPSVSDRVGRWHRDAPGGGEMGPRSPQHGRQRAAHGRSPGGVARR